MKPTLYRCADGHMLRIVFRRGASSAGAWHVERMTAEGWRSEHKARSWRMAARWANQRFGTTIEVREQRRWERP